MVRRHLSSLLVSGEIKRKQLSRIEEERVKALLLSEWDTWKSYGVFVLWGLAHGVITFVVLIVLLPSRPSVLIISLTICALGGGVLSAIVFGMLFKAPRWLQPLGFVVVGAILPYLAACGITSVDHSNLEFLLDPLTMLFTFLWTAYTFPFALAIAVLYLFIYLIRWNTRRIEHPEAQRKARS